MLGGVNAMASELIVASYKVRRFIFDQDAAYEPGVRIYVNNHRIIDDGLDVRDGIHFMKVHESLSVWTTSKIPIR